MKSTNPEFSERRREVDRLARNWTALLDNMLEMVVLIGEDYIIEYMNPNAVSSFGDLRGKKCREHLCNAGERCERNCPVRQTISGEKQAEVLEAKIGDVYVEYTSVLFRGYLGDNLVMMVMRNISERIRHEMQMSEFHENLGVVLRDKISELHETEKIQEKLYKEINVLKNKLHKRNFTDDMIGSSRRMRDLREMIYQVAESDATILITGESGTGKELVANLINKCSLRNDKPFLKVNCNTINDNLLESDLFGYEKGAFTGANSRQIGKFEIVNGGSLFLDEIGDISPRMQAALLRVLQNGEIIRVGGNKAFTVDVRIIAATNVELEKMVQSGRFRLDLYYRLNIINIAIPPLRDRKEDIVELATFFVKKYRKAFKKDIDFLPDSLFQRLLQHDWPGNVRELENVIQRAVLMARDSIITDKDLFIGTKQTVAQNDYISQVCDKFGRKSLKDLTADFEKEVILQCLKKNEANVLEAANELKVGKTALYSKMKRYRLNPKNSK